MCKGKKLAKNEINSSIIKFANLNNLNIHLKNFLNKLLFRKYCIGTNMKETICADYIN